MKQFFKINEKYRFEWNDLRCFITVINVILIMVFGVSICWFGLAVAVIGLVKDFVTHMHLTGIFMHLSSAVLNGYFLGLFYGII